MTDSSGNDDTGPGLRFGGWVPEPRPTARPLVPPPLRPAPGARRGAVPPTGPGAHAVPRRSPYPVVLAAATVGAVAATVVALLPTSPGPARGPTAVAAPSAVDAEPTHGTAEPIRPFSPAPVFLRSREAAPAKGPSTRARPITPTTRSVPSNSDTARRDELVPLPASGESGLRSVGGGAETFVSFVNERRETVIVHWLDYDGHRRRYAALGPGQSYRQHTYVGHPWVVTDTDGRALACFQPTSTTATARIR